MRLGPSAVCKSSQYVSAIEVVGICRILILMRCQDASA